VTVSGRRSKAAIAEGTVPERSLSLLRCTKSVRAVQADSEGDERTAERSWRKRTNGLKEKCCADTDHLASARRELQD
jgi:hypothetical protein